MLSDEEKAVLKTAKENYGLTSAEQKILVNLIEKQSKEIEHQIEKRANQRNELAILNAKQVEFNKLVNTVNSYKGQFKKQQKEIEEYKKQLDLDNECEIALNSKVMDLEKEIEELKDDNKKYIDLHYVPYEQYTSKLNELNKKWKDKIKAKIEEINKEMLNEENSLELFYRKKYCKEVLQSLLEKE